VCNNWALSPILYFKNFVQYIRYCTSGTLYNIYNTVLQKLCTIYTILYFRNFVQYIQYCTSGTLYNIYDTVLQKLCTIYTILYFRNFVQYIQLNSRQRQRYIHEGSSQKHTASYETQNIASLSCKCLKTWQLSRPKTIIPNCTWNQISYIYCAFYTKSYTNEKKQIIWVRVGVLKVSKEKKRKKNNLVIGLTSHAIFWQFFIYPHLYMIHVMITI